MKKKNIRGRKEPQHRTNQQIKSREVRVVNEGGTFDKGIYAFDEALEIANVLGVDLVETNSKATPPVCQIIEYSKFIYEQKKKERDLKGKSHKTKVKELRFTSNTGDHDIQVAANKAKKFLGDGDKVKANLSFKGRNIIFKDNGERVLLKFAQLLEDYGHPEAMPKLQGKKMFMTIKPKGQK
jgi:translation initiation factor IF-3|tara:strand:- start:29360 stop:29905 length:546 start_codon:yes stop_codon:yes gene_type:complete